MKTLALLLLLAVSPFQIEHDQWHAAREASLRADKGWLTVAGLYWLKEGVNQLDLPAPSPRCQVLFKDGKVTVTLDDRTRQLRPNSPDASESGPFTLTVIERGQRYGIRLRDRNAQTRRDFKGLHYFPVAERHRVVAKWVAEPRQLPITNVLGLTEPMNCPGYAVFRLNGRELRLYPVLESPHARQLFFIFRDQTAARETYGAGRFLDTDLPKDGAVTLDFNRAYNPPCAFTPYATCPLPPKENRLAVRIEAGELKYAGHY